MPEIGIYARVSTTDLDPQRQLDELREFAKDMLTSQRFTPTQTSVSLW